MAPLLTRLAAALLLCAVAPQALPTPARAAGEAPPGWRLYPLEGRAALAATQSGEDGVHLVGTDAVSLIVRPHAAWISADTCLSWRWRVDAGPPPTDLSRRGEDDRAIALWVGFRADAESMTLAQRYAYGMVRFLSPVTDPPGFILAYTWGGYAAQPRWEQLPQPFMGQIARQRVLRPASDHAEGWVEQTVMLDADFRAAFGVPPSQLMQFGVFADGDNTHTRTDVAIEGLRLHRCPAAAPPAPMPARQGPARR